MQWTDDDQAQAMVQGWGLFEIWDQRVLYEILRADNCEIFRTDHDARAFVRARALGPDHDALCARAWRAVFDSQLGC